MKSLKAMVIAASAVGAVAVGGVTWAAAGDLGATDPRSATGDLPRAVAKATQGAPKATVPSPTCLPAQQLPGKAQLPDKKQVAEKLKAGAAHQPGPGEGRTPQAPVATPKLPQAPAGKPDLPQAPAVKPGAVRSNLPVCKDAETLPKSGARTPSGPKDVRTPQVPDATQLACDKLAPVVRVGGALERTAMVSKGLKHVSSKSGVKRLAGKPACAVTQKWVSRAGGAAGWLTVERIKTPAGMAERDVRKALNVPENAVRSTSVNGTAILMAPGGRSAAVLIDPAGYTVLVDGSPVLSTSAQDVAAQLAKAIR